MGMCRGSTAWAAGDEQAQAAGRCTIEKTDRRFKHLSGATLELRDAKGTVLCTFETGTAAIDISSRVTAGESYSVHEAAAPTGYAFADDARFHVVEDADGTKGIVVDEGISSKAGGGLVMVDLPLSPISVSKRDANGKELPGASMTLTDKTTSTAVETWTSADEPHKISRGLLTAGHSYRLTEDKAPEGYQMAVEVTFELARDGNVQGVSGGDVTFDQETRTFVVTDALVPVPEPQPEPQPEPDPEPTPDATTSTCDVRVGKSWSGAAEANVQVINVIGSRQSQESGEASETKEPTTSEHPGATEEPQKEETPAAETPTAETPTPDTPTPETPTNTTTPTTSTNDVATEKTASTDTTTPATSTPAAYTATTDLDAAKGAAADELPKTGEESLAYLIPVAGIALALIGAGLRHRFIR